MGACLLTTIRVYTLQARVGKMEREDKRWRRTGPSGVRPTFELEKLSLPPDSNSLLAYFFILFISVSFSPRNKTENIKNG